ncbi:unnamed protein product [Phyllotreta striolata]|uniref:Thymidylate kinase-like domain-containing protein n=1 Tax=Phyllotreta striolata TaxID=444603 RepID=A0A9N9XP97_PHYSR|nr:unnamed protein product [Phyllotreta striolata]
MANHFHLHKTLESTMSTLEKPEYRAIPAVKELLTMYETTRQELENKVGAKKHSFIVLEGLDGSGKSTVARILANRLNARYWQSPTKRIKNSKDFLHQDTLIQLRNAFYSLGNYIAALEVRALLPDSPVIMDRFWHSTSAFAIARAGPLEIEMPSKIYEWPEDLLKPDLVLLLDLDEAVRWERISHRVHLTPQELLLECAEYREKTNLPVEDHSIFYNPISDHVNNLLTMNLFFKTFIFLNILRNFDCLILQQGKTNVVHKDVNDTDLPILYPRAATILKLFEEPQNENYQGVRELLDYYHKAEMKKNEFLSSGGAKKHPLILLEGLAGSGKTTISEALAKLINGTQVHSPLHTLKKFEINFFHNRLLNNAYQQLAQYLTAMEILPLLQNGPVVLDRYYPSTTTYCIGRLMYYRPKEYSMPPKGAEIYNCPEDLMRPDIMFFLDVDEEERVRRLLYRTKKLDAKLGANEKFLLNHSDYRQYVLLAYKNLDNPPMIMVDNNLPLTEVVDDVYKKVLPLLK